MNKVELLQFICISSVLKMYGMHRLTDYCNMFLLRINYLFKAWIYKCSRNQPNTFYIIYTKQFKYAIKNCQKKSTFYFFINHNHNHLINEYITMIIDLRSKSIFSHLS